MDTAILIAISFLVVVPVILMAGVVLTVMEIIAKDVKNE